MPITLITGPANAGKAERVMSAVRRHLAHGRPPLLVVPTRADAEHYLRELAGGGAAVGVRVERFAGLLRELVARAGLGEAALGALARERVIEAVALREHAPASAGFVRALGELFAELRVRRVTPARWSAALSSLERAGAPAAHGHQLARLFSAYCRELERMRRVDAEQRAARALDALRERPSLWRETPTLLYGFDDLTALQLDVIDTLGRVVDAPVTVSLSYEPGRVAFAARAASFHALAPHAAEHLALAARSEHYAPPARRPLAHLERSLFEPGVDAADPAGAVRLLEGGGERAELELVAREIRSLLASGMPAQEIAVLVRAGAGATDVELLEEVFTAAAVPFALERRRPFAASALGAALVGLLRCVPGAAAPTRAAAGEHGGEHAGPHGGEHASDPSVEPAGAGELLAWLRAPGVLRAGEDGGVTLADRLERAARRAGAHTAAEARELFEQRNWPLEAIDRLAEAQQRGPAALCERADRELYRLFCAPRRSAAQLLPRTEREDAVALARGRRALAELRELARAAGELAPASAAQLADVLARLELVDERSAGTAPAAPRVAPAPDATAGPVPPPAVAVLEALALRARRVRALFVCGLQEGVFPARSRPQPLLGEDERARLAELSGLRLGARADGSLPDQLGAERYLLYAAVSRPQERLYLSWHAADDDGQPSARSLFVDDVCDLFDASLQASRARRALGAVDAAPEPGRLPARSCVRAPAEESGGGERVRRLRDRSALRELGERVWSASSLERWLACPVSWFVERLLRPEPIDPDPEPLARGALAHAALKETFEGLRRETGSARLTPGKLELARELLARELDANERAHPLSAAPERRAAVRRRLRADLERYLEHASALSGALEPSAFELAFGFPPEGCEAERAHTGERGGLPALELGDGLRLRGRIDRVDIGDGEAVVYDYKGARAPGAARWRRDGDLQVALYMRAVEELLGVRAVGGFYQPLTGEDLRARGLLDAGAAAAARLEAVPTDVLEPHEARELVAQALASARGAAREAARGELHARPQTCSFRGGCMYPSICRCGHGGR